MTKTIERKVRIYGSSYCVSIPVRWLRQHKIIARSNRLSLRPRRWRIACYYTHEEIFIKSPPEGVHVHEADAEIVESSGGLLFFLIENWVLVNDLLVGDTLLLSSNKTNIGIKVKESFH